MSTGAIIAIIVVALIVIALLAFMLPRMRAKAQVQKRERELQQRRDRAAEEQRSEANARERQASEAEQRARIAAKEAEAERAQAQLHQERAGLHEKGMADHELIDESERDRFADVTNRHDRDGDGVDDRREAVSGRGDGGTPDNDYERGRRDEAMDENDRPARFDRNDDVAAESATERGETRSRY
jgi:multidrug efflux pump subunit AcrA (membrane-fusion protein)